MDRRDARQVNELHGLGAYFSAQDVSALDCGWLFGDAEKLRR